MCDLCTPGTPNNSSEVQFEHFIGACVKGSNMLPIYLDQTIEECKERCELNPECKAIEYYHNGAHKTNNKCLMQSSKDKTGCVGENVDLYVKVQVLNCLSGCSDDPGFVPYNLPTANPTDTKSKN